MTKTQREQLAYLRRCLVQLHNYCDQPNGPRPAVIQSDVKVMLGTLDSVLLPPEPKKES